MKKTRQITLAQTKDWDQMVKAGRGRQVAALLKECKDDGFRQACPGPVLLEMAELARRCGQPVLGLYFIDPLTKKDAEPWDQASPQARLGRASLLFDLGLISEGREYLRKVSPQDEPRKLLIQAWQHFSEWDYAGARPLLDQYVGYLDPKSYAWSVAKVNQLAAMATEEKIDQAAEELIDDLQVRQAPVLIGNCLEIWAEQLLRRSEFARAGEFLDRAQSLHRQAQKRDSIYIDKWILILKIKTGQITDYGRVIDFKASAPFEWEVHRSLDFEWAVHHRNADWLRQIYFATPFAAFRRKISAVQTIDQSPLLRHLPLDLLSPLMIGDQGQDDLPAQNQLRPGDGPDKLQHLFTALTADLYKPKKVFELFAAVYPDEHYIPGSSLLKMNQLLSRFRNQLETSKNPMRLVRQKGFFSLQSSGQLVWYLQKSEAGPETTRLRAESILLDQLSRGPRSSLELAQALGQTRRMTQLHLKSLANQRRIWQPRRGLYQLLLERK